MSGSVRVSIMNLESMANLVVCERLKSLEVCWECNQGLFMIIRLGVLYYLIYVISYIIELTLSVCAWR